MNQKLYEHLLNHYPTPFYYFDTDELTHRVQYLRSMLPKRVQLCFAAKANPFLLKVLEDQVDFFEICSPGELDICQNLAIPPEKIVLSGVYKDEHDLESYFEKAQPLHLYTMESIQQYEQLRSLSERYQRRTFVVLRLSSGNQFGLDEASIEQIVASRAQAPFIEIQGIQFFSGTQKRRSHLFEKEMAKLETLMDHLKEKYNFTISLLEYGPGLPVDYFETGIDEAKLLHDLSTLLDRLDPNLEIVLEIGRTMAASCGYYFSRVVDLKQTGEYKYAILDGGIHHLVYYGQSMGLRVPPYEVYPARQGETCIYQICGALCTVNDLLLKAVALPSLAIGDAFIFKMAGAYCPTEGMNLFLSRCLPAIILGDATVHHLVRKALPTSVLNTPKGDL